MPDVIRAEDKLPSEVVPVSYHVWVAPDVEGLMTDGQVRIEVEVRSPTRSITLNAYQIDFRKVTLDEAGEPPTITLDAAHERATFTFTSLVRPGRHTLTIAFASRIARATYGLFAVDITNPEGKADRLLATQFENSGARRFMPCWDEPALKASFTLHVTAPADRMVVSNMPAAQTTALADGRRQVDFAATPKMSSYLLFLSIGDYERINRTVDGVDVGVVMRRGQVDKGRYALDAAEAALKYYEGYLGVPYPLPKLDMVAAPLKSPELSGMENWGAILYFEPAIAIAAGPAHEAQRRGVFRVVAHEIAHQWFGDLVTMADWNELWLNEGFADWMEVKAMAALHPEWRGWESELIGRERAMAWDARGSTPPMVRRLGVTANGPTPDAITYEKGEFLLRMLEDHVGEAAFRDGLRRYLRDRQYGAVTGDDLWAALKAASRIDVAAMAHGFTDQAGAPLISVETTPDGIRLSQSRFGADALARQMRTWRTPVRVAPPGSDQAAQYEVTRGRPALVRSAPGAALSVNAGQKGYFRVDYDAPAFEALRREFARLAPIDQLGLLYDQLALADSGDRPIGRYLELLRKIPVDADPLVWSQAAGALGMFDTVLVDSPDQAGLHRAARLLLAPVQAQIGAVARPGEAVDATDLRARIASLLARFDAPTPQDLRAMRETAARTPMRQTWSPQIVAWARAG